MTDKREPAAIDRSGPDECAYLLRRADDHRQLAERHAEADARTIHLRFQRLYEERASQVAGAPAT